MAVDRTGILVVEDQLLLAMDLSQSLEREGYETLGPCVSVDAALSLLEQETPAAAILDINLGSGVTSAPIAEELARRNVPFAFLTAYGRDIPIVDDFPEARYEGKPVNGQKLRRLLDGLIPEES